MKKCRCQGAMTVFFSILTVLFLSLGCTLAESARVQGARVKAAAVLDLGIFSVFGEYERELLEEYDVFGVDGAYGGGTFGAKSLQKRLDEYMSYNITPDRMTILTGGSLFPMDTGGSRVTEYLLLTDESGGVFRDQVVQNLKSALGTEIAAGVLKARQQAEELEKAGETYEQQEKAAEEGLLEAEEKQRQLEEAEKAKEQQGTGEIVVVEPDKEKLENPLDLIKKIKKMGILGIVLKNPEELSAKRVTQKELPSHRKLEKGGMVWERDESGIVGEGIFQEYLFEHFSCAVDEKKEGALDYELEYLLAGKDSDEGNLKTVVNKLLLLREGANFLYLLSNTEMRHSAEALSVVLSGGTPGLTAAIGAALLAAWAYGESLLDVRILLAGGKVPVTKTKESFRLSLENLGRLLDVLKECGEAEGEGMDYRGYLQLLFLTGKRSSYPMRALDLIECRLRREDGLQSFQVDHCVAGMEAEAEWNLTLVFAGIPAAFLGIHNGEITYETRGRFIYTSE